MTDLDDTIECPMCERDQHTNDARLGQLGTLEHFRCRWCSWNWARSTKHEDTDEVQDPSVHDYNTTDHCDQCKRYAQGTMYHRRGRTGRIAPVLFLCKGCQS